MSKWEYGQQWLDALDVALAAERRATVARILRKFVASTGGPAEFRAILDEEAAR